MANYLTFSSAEPFTIAVGNAKKGWDGILYYSTNASTWSVWDGTTAIASAEHGGEQRIYMRGVGNSKITGGFISYRWVLTGSDISCIGNIENLLDFETVANGKHPAMTEKCYASMFYDCTALTTAPELPATTLATSCYNSMFRGCTNLKTAPELPATTLADWCCYEMFRGCTSLTIAPELPATTLAKDCYENMFMGCTSLTMAPALPAAALAEYCYFNMFQGCTNLTTAPELPATTLAEKCYYCMFQGCTSLTIAPELPATTLAKDCYNSMFRGCTNLTTAPALPATTLAEMCYYRMFEGCTNLKTAPELHATILAGWCYCSMFYGCTNIKLSETQSDEYQNAYRIPTEGTGTTAIGAMGSMFEGTGGTFTGTPDINTTYYMAVPEPEPTLTEGDFYKVINGQWVKCDSVKPTGNEWVKQDEYLY